MQYWIALAVFLLSCAAYVRTLAPTVVFWDVGEFCAAAFTLQVPHPPGAPLFLLIARVSSMIPLIGDIAVRMHIISAIGSSITVALLYLIIVDLAVAWRGVPGTVPERFAVHGSAIIGALSLAFGSTFWFNAGEAEVYGLSMAFVSLIVFLGLRWFERASEDTGDRYILLISYLVGLSIGVHLLAVLALFPVMLFGYFRYYEFRWKSFAVYVLVAVLAFLAIYPGIVRILPSLLDGEVWGIRSVMITGIPIVLLLGVLYGIIYSAKKKKRVLNVSLLSFLLVVIGYSTYILVYIRANAHPPMNENDPSTLGRFVSYLGREQYGDAPVFNRRWDIDPEKKRFQQNYTSDLDYLWRYQVKKMYWRYLAWNYIGTQGNFRDAGWDWKPFFGIPFILGLIGAYYQWRKQPKMACVMTVLFILMGVVLALYQNQQEPQPRERDYFYVGSFFAFSVWIGFGVLALIEFIKGMIRVRRAADATAYGVLAFALVFVPIRMFQANFRTANRSGNYVAWDYSYNVLQSCEPDAVLVTQGDNDTFPLWYLQDVVGIRRDIRIVNLSLLNMPWYIKQLKNETPYGAKKVPISTPDIDIEHIGAIRFNPQWMELPVPPSVLRQYSADSAGKAMVFVSSVTKSGALRFFMTNTIQSGVVKAIRVQDIMIYDIIRASNWQRPVYFAMTASEDSKIGLRDYMQLKGLAFKLVPFKSRIFWGNLDEKELRQNLFTDIKSPSKQLQEGFLWRGFQDSTVYYDEDTRRLLSTNYRNMFIALALYYCNVEGRPEQMSPVLDRMEQVLPRRIFPLDFRVKYDVASFYRLAGNERRYREYTREVIDEVKRMVEKAVEERLSQYNPYIILFHCYEGTGMYQDAENILTMIGSVYQNVPHIGEEIQKLRTRLEHERSAEQRTQPLRQEGRRK
jgi:hypothetical protein